ncbi:SusC/RagA family TonB-linked outer membrane protein [Hoylesella oralis]|uniref:SusC/RagA family TonB-linked outer membrane protein n=1 Tax=Hoylesella oralis TaxID=28134 RepID=UPI0028E886A4|nr:SusC/RagA family TonB-linked outer membrane protein [Hoylesella oralis]
MYIQANIKKVFAVCLLVLVSLAAIAQSGDIITGTVKTEQGETLVGAYVNVVGTQIKAVTNAKGQFTINATPGQTLQVSYIGMATRRVKITALSMDITLYDNSHQVDEVVITGYQNIRNRVYTGAATSVKMNDIKLEGIADVSRMLEGRVPGLSIQNISGTFGSAPRINIRGGASIIGNVQPLWVIDGAVYEDLVHLSIDQLASGDAVTLISSAVSGLNPADIQDIQVLKDASATSVYGARALNGVIVITTKSGRKNSPLRISYSTENTVRLKPRYADFDLLNSQETMSLYQEMNDKGYFGISNSLYGRRSGIYYQLYKGISTINPATGTYYLPNTPDAKMDFLRKREYANTNWFDLLFTMKPITNHSITLSGGGKNTATYASIGFYYDGGWTIADNVRRLTANIKNTFYINDKLITTLTAQGNIRSQKAPGTMPQRKNNAIGTFERDFDINPFSYALGTSRTLRPYNENGSLEYYRNNWAPFNILNEYANNKMNINVLDFKLQGEATYRINTDLAIKTLISTRQAYTTTTHEVYENSNVVQAYRANENPFVAQQNIYLVHDKDNPLLQPKVGLTHGGILNKTEASLKSFLARIAFDFDKRIDQHDVKAFAFTEIRSAVRTVNPFQGYGIQYDRGNQIYTNPLIFDKLINEGNSYFNLHKRNDRGVTFSFNGTYGYAGKYIFNMVFNCEGSNTSGKGARALWLPTWNIGAKWNIDQEAFMKGNSTISRLALRASYGLTAKMNEEAINANSIFKGGIVNRYHFKDRENKLNILHLENRDLTWEKMYELNIGVELGLFNNRISTTLDVYQRNTFDLIDLVRTSGVGGQYYKYANFGDMRTRGIELGVHTKNIVTETFNWSTSLTLSAMNQKITRLLNTPNAFDMVAGRGRGNIVGYPRGSLFSFNFQGLNNNGLPTFDFGLYPSSQGEYSNIAGADFLDTQYAKSYLLYHGPIEPQVIGGLSNTLKYKDWELSFFVTMQAGNKIRLNPTFDPEFGDLNVFSKSYYNRWLNPGDELKTDIPVLPSQELIAKVGKENIERAYNTYNYSQKMVADGSFVRMKNISLGYNIPDKFLKKMKLHTMNLRLNITNPFLIYSDKKLKGQDPEYYKSGGVSLPTPKQYTLTLNIGF